MQKDIKILRTQAQKLHKYSADMLWSRWTGDVYADEMLSAHKFYEEWKVPQLKFILSMAEESRSFLKKRQLLNLWAFLVEQAMEYLVLEQTIKIDKEELMPSILLKNNNKVFLRELSNIIILEKDRNRRSALSRIYDKERFRLVPLLRQKLSAQVDWLKTEFSMSYLEFSSIKRDIDINYLRKLICALLKGTEKVYSSYLSEMKKRMFNQKSVVLELHDTNTLLSSKDFDVWFPANKLISSILHIVDMLNLKDAWKFIKVDMRPLPSKIPGAFCVPVEVPSDIRISINAMSGFSDYLSLFHEAAHALQAISSKNLPFEFQLLGPLSVSEAFAFFFESILSSPQWCREVMKMSNDAAEDFRRFRLFHRLFLVRKYAARAWFELNYNPCDQSAGTHYRRIMEDSCGLKLSESEGNAYLQDHNEFLYSANYLLGWVLEAMFVDYLKRNSGDEWWRSRHTTDILLELMSKGNSISALEFARRLGYQNLDESCLLEKFCTE